MRKAGFFARLIAFIISLIISFIVVLIADIDPSFTNQYLSVVSNTVSTVLAITLAFLEFLYFGFFWSTNGATLGMAIFNIRVVRSDQAPVGFFRAGLRRTLGYWISGLIFGLGYIWAIFDNDKQAWHDMILNTVVVEG